MVRPGCCMFLAHYGMFVLKHMKLLQMFSEFTQIKTLHFEIHFSLYFLFLYKQPVQFGARCRKYNLLFCFLLPVFCSGVNV